MITQLQTPRLILKNYSQRDLSNIYALQSELLVRIYSDKQVQPL